MDRRTFWLLNLACFSLTACRQDKIQTYQILKESPPAVMGEASASAMEIEWKIPEGWQEQAPSSMRVGSFLVKGPDGQQADVSVIPLAGDAGGDLFNINRWRGQISLEPISAADLPKQSETISPAGRKMLLIDFVNGDKRVIATLYARGGHTWFFKMTGGDAIVRSEKPAFMQFLRSLHFTDEPRD